MPIKTEKLPLIREEGYFSLGRQKAYMSDGDGKALDFLHGRGEIWFSLENIANAAGWGGDPKEEIDELVSRVSRCTSDRIESRKVGKNREYRMARPD